jgi:hypothetical protein
VRSAGLDERVPVNVVFVGFDRDQVGDRAFRDGLPQRYRPVVRSRLAYEAPAFNYAADGALATPFLGSLADDNWVDGTQSFVFAFISPSIVQRGYGLTTTEIHKYARTQLGLQPVRSRQRGPSSGGRLHLNANVIAGRILAGRRAKRAGARRQPTRPPAAPRAPWQDTTTARPRSTPERRTSGVRAGLRGAAKANPSRPPDIARLSPSRTTRAIVVRLPTKEPLHAHPRRCRE